jgi:hypothetical protein
VITPASLPEELLLRLQTVASMEGRSPAVALQRLLDANTPRPLGKHDLCGVRDELESLGEMSLPEARELVAMVARLSLGVPEFRNATLTVYGDDDRVLAGVIVGGTIRVPNRTPKAK